MADLKRKLEEEEELKKEKIWKEEERVFLEKKAEHEWIRAEEALKYNPL